MRVVLVEGASDKAALDALAARLGRDLAADGITVVAIGGATNVRAAAAQYEGADVVGLCDVQEAPWFTRVLDTVYVCDRDLEDELIRALGADAVEAVLAEHGDLAAFRTFEKQPDQQGKPTHDHLRRFMGTKSHRKERYAALLVDALPLDRVPQPLLGALG